MLKRLCLTFLAIILMAFALDAPAAAATKTIVNPTYNGNRLDWCKDWGVGCGKEAADAYCQSIGYQSANSFSEAVDIGASSPTRLITTGAVCDQGFCDGFAQITCFKYSPPAVFNSPVYNGNRLDWCAAWAQGCGAEAANLFCKQQGFDHTTGFTQDVDIGASSPTRIITTGALCDQPFCDGFKMISCDN
jgi:hypothetical protein